MNLQKHSDISQKISIATKQFQLNKNARNVLICSSLTFNKIQFFICMETMHILYHLEQQKQKTPSTCRYTKRHSLCIWLFSKRHWNRRHQGIF